MKNFLEVLGRIGNAILDSINRAKARDAVDHAADTISNGGVQHELDINMADKLRDRKDQ